MAIEQMMNLLLVVNVGVALLVIALAVPMILEKIKPNQWYGFRTAKTLRDEAVWYPANKYAGKCMVWAGVSIIALSLVLYCGARGLGLSTVGVAIVWCAVLIVPIIAMTAVSLAYLKKL